MATWTKRIAESYRNTLLKGQMSLWPSEGLLKGTENSVKDDLPSNKSKVPKQTPRTDSKIDSDQMVINDYLENS